MVTAIDHRPQCRGDRQVLRLFPLNRRPECLVLCQVQVPPQNMANQVQRRRTVVGMGRVATRVVIRSAGIVFLAGEDGGQIVPRQLVLCKQLNKLGVRGGPLRGIVGAEEGMHFSNFVPQFCPRS